MYFDECSLHSLKERVRLLESNVYYSKHIPMRMTNISMNETFNGLVTNIYIVP